MLIKKNTKRKCLCLLLITLFTNIVFIQAAQTDYPQIITQEDLLSQEDNRQFGAIVSDNSILRQDISSEYASTFTYFRGNNRLSKNYQNDSEDTQISSDSEFYKPARFFDVENGTWTNLPTYLVADNLTETNPNLIFTQSINVQGALNLNTETILYGEKDNVYLYKVFPDGFIYDLDMRTTGVITYYMYLNGTLQSAGNVNGHTRDNQFVIPSNLEQGEIELYITCTTDVTVIFSPVKLATKILEEGKTIFDSLRVEVDQYWNETIQAFEDNHRNYDVSTYKITIASGTYKFKYETFDNSILTEAYIFTDQIMNAMFSTTPSRYSQSIIPFVGNNEIEIYFDKQTTIYILIDAQPGDDFEYVLSCKRINPPVFSTDKQLIHIDNPSLTYLVNLTESKLVWFNSSSTITPYMFKYTAKGDFYWSFVSISDSSSATKLLLEPGVYFITNLNDAGYDIKIQCNLVDVQHFDYATDSYKQFSIEQNIGVSESYRVFEIPSLPLQYNSFNISINSNANYSADLRLYLYTGSINYQYGNLDYYIGQKQVNGEFISYGINNTQCLNLLDQSNIEKTYVIIEMRDLYNTTGTAFPNKGDVIVNQTSAQFRLIHDSDYTPDVLNNHVIHDVDLSMDSTGSTSYASNFVTSESLLHLYNLRANIHQNTWYDVKVQIVNATLDNTYRYLYMSNTLGYTQRYSRNIWLHNTYQVGEYSSFHYDTYDDSNISDVQAYFEFGALDVNLLLQLFITSLGDNGTISVTLTAHSCTIFDTLTIPEIEMRRSFFKENATLLAIIAGGAVVLGGIIGGIVALVNRGKGKTKSKHKPKRGKKPR